MASSEVRIRAVTMTGFRPVLSEMVPMSSMVNASVKVLIDSGRLPTAGETLNSRANSGRSGWTS
jgi:hypothetical protein